MDESIITAVDMGTELIKILSAVYDNEKNKITSVFKTSYPSKGFSRGYIVNTNEAIKALESAVLQHERQFKIKIAGAYFSIGGLGVKSKRFRIPHSTAGPEVSSFDFKKIEEKAKIIHKKIPGNILESQPIKYIIDGFDHYSFPLKMKAKKIYANFFTLSIPPNHLISLENVVENNDILPLEISSGLLSVISVVINEENRKNGCLLVDIGSETTSLLVFKNNKPLYLGVLPFGSRDVTLEISKKEKIEFSKAEFHKKESKISLTTRRAIDKKFKEIAKAIKKELKDNLDKEDGEVAEVILIGGGSQTIGIKKIFKQILSLPVRKNKSTLVDRGTDFSIAYGLIINSLKKEKEKNTFSLSKFFRPLKKIVRKLSI